MNGLLQDLRYAFRQFRRSRLNRVFTSMDVYHRTGYLLSTATGAEPVPGVTVSDGFLGTLGVTPLIGRDFHNGEDLPEAPRTVLLSYKTWKDRFGGRTTVLGESVPLSGIANTIIAVLPQKFQFAPKGNAEFWTTLHASDPCGVRRSCPARRAAKVDPMVALRYE